MAIISPPLEPLLLSVNLALPLLCPARRKPGSDSGFELNKRLTLASILTARFLTFPRRPVVDESHQGEG